MHVLKRLLSVVALAAIFMAGPVKADETVENDVRLDAFRVGWALCFDLNYAAITGSQLMTTAEQLMTEAGVLRPIELHSRKLLNDRVRVIDFSGLESAVYAYEDATCKVTMQGLDDPQAAYDEFATALVDEGFEEKSVDGANKEAFSSPRHFYMRSPYNEVALIYLGLARVEPGTSSTGIQIVTQITFVSKEQMMN